MEGFLQDHQKWLGRGSISHCLFILLNCSFPDHVLAMFRPSRQLRPHLCDSRHGQVVENRGQMQLQHFVIILRSATYFVLLKAVIPDSWVIDDTHCQYIRVIIYIVTKLLSWAVFPLVFGWWLLCDNVVIYDNITLILPAWPEFLWRHMRQSVPAWSRILFIYVGNNLNILSLPDPSKFRRMNKKLILYSKHLFWML